MNTSLLRVAAALVALLFVVAACASDTGAQWTYAPIVANADGEGADGASTAAPEAEGESVTQELTGEADPAEAAQAEIGSGDTVGAETSSDTPVEGAAGAPAGTVDEPRVIELQAIGSLQFTDANGQQIKEIPVTPGETVLFRIENTAGFEHNFYIGTDAELSVPAATTETGIPNWSSGVQELQWTVPDDISGLKFGCTVAGHYALMQGTFSVASADPAAVQPAQSEVADPPGAEPGVSAPPSAAAGTGASEATATDHEMAEMATETESTASEPPGDGTPGDSSDVAEPTPATDANSDESGVRVIDLIAMTTLQFADPNGEKVTDIPVTPGETILFRVDNTSNFDHNMYIGTDAELSPSSATTDTGIANWSSGVQELEWVVPDDITGLKFGCTIPGHYPTMQGTFSVSP